ncbi:ATP-binding protein [Streptomyces meridianus]|uniref:ATP-binding protein n=1 Tax=Streptomyces meridianus TaxID=2938945 RepID=A0ABT0XCY1_9ACTN|nr:ATP-binding protein [Streptomyces meridianus]MCM2579783.1 ATP-binding protein [Streptomyces meridianus]
MISNPSRHCTVELHALPSRIGQVRRIVSAQLRHWRLDPLIDFAALGVTELLSNVHRHAEPDKRCTVELVLLLDRLTVSVRDHDPREPGVREAGPGDTGGRGLRLIAAFSECWGVRPQEGGGKVVWFTLSAAGEHPQAAAAADHYALRRPTVLTASSPPPAEVSGTPQPEHARARSALVG